MSDRQRPTGRTVTRRRIGATRPERKRIGMAESIQRESIEVENKREKLSETRQLKEAEPLYRRPQQTVSRGETPRTRSARPAAQYARKPVLETDDYYPRRGGEKRFAVKESAPPAKGKKLEFRHELKYYINYHDYIILRQALKVILQPDEHGGKNNSYHIRSLYFDDRDNKALVEKLSGTDRRNKYRIRIYNYGKNSVIRFENKIKRGQFIAKTNLPLTHAEYEKILNGEYDFLRSKQNDLANELYLRFSQDGLAPKVVVDYEREAYVHPLERIRITFDKNLHAGTYTGDIFNRNLPVMPILDPGVMILEVKFNKFLPPHIQAVLNNAMAPTRSAISKYTLCRKYE